ncbi:hypothetical protein ACFTAO_27630 [Paenibacillus rhizoplanae]
MAEEFAAVVRCADFYIGYPGRRGAPGRALVDNGSHLVLNYGNDWSYASVHSSLEVRNALIPSAGSGNNGIIFPSDPGGRQRRFGLDQVLSLQRGELRAGHRSL